MVLKIFLSTLFIITYTHSSFSKGIEKYKEEHPSCYEYVLTKIEESQDINIDIAEYIIESCISGKEIQKHRKKPKRFKVNFNKQNEDSIE